MIRVLVVDDSVLFRSLLQQGLERDKDLKVVGRVGSGEEALNRLPTLKPDVITMDVVLPGMDGFAVVEKIMERQPTPILVISSLEREKIVFRMLAAGALDVVGKPGPGGQGMDDIAHRLKAIATATVRRSFPKAQPRVAAGTPRTPPSPSPSTARKAVVIASSAGGPQALLDVLPGLPPDLPVPVLVVQHITAGFARGLAEWLDGESDIEVRLALAGEPLVPGVVLVAPDGFHLVLTRERRIELDAGSHGSLVLKPAADVTLASAAEVFGKDLLAVVLTGMGRDGEAGVQKVKAAGGRVVVQDQASSAVYGMPRAARPYADAELPLEAIAREIVRFSTS